jgi:hypothetical protein
MAAFPSVHIGTRYRLEDDLWYDRCYARNGQDGGGASLYGQIPDQGELNQLTSNKRKCLSGPNGDEALEPFLLHFGRFSPPPQGLKDVL